MLWYKLQCDPSLCIREHPLQGMVQLMNDRLWEEQSTGIARKVGAPAAGLWGEVVLRWAIRISTGSTNYIMSMVPLESPLFLWLCMPHASGGNSQGPAFVRYHTMQQGSSTASPLCSGPHKTNKNKITEKRRLSVLLQGKMSVWNLLLVLQQWWGRGWGGGRSLPKPCTMYISLLGSPQQCSCGVAF